MKVSLLESVDDFIDQSTTFRAKDPLRTNVIGSVALSIASGDRTYDDYRWWIVTDGASVVGVAMRTSPFNMLLSSMPLDAARALGGEVALYDDLIPGVTGSREIVDALIDGYVGTDSSGSLRPLTLHRTDLLYELDELKAPDVNGVGRLVRHDETEFCAELFVAFAEEAALPALTRADARNLAATKVAHGEIFCWEADGRVVAVAGHAPIVTTVDVVLGRVGPVYTPPQFRNRGYGSAATAFVSRRLLERGARVMLYTDAANPTSNGIYRTLGYRLIDELVEMRFSA